MSLDYIRMMPKVELHVHLEGAIGPETLLTLAQSNHVALPARSVEEVRAWYTFTSFPHFAEVYTAISRCIRTPDDIELVTREFLIKQAAQHILHTEATYTAFAHYRNHAIAFADQLAAINRARAWAARALGVSLLLIIDIPRKMATTEEGLIVADWAISGMGNGVAALGLGGDEVGSPPEVYHDAFARARDAGLPCVLHAGETVGPASIWSALRVAHTQRIGHGVRCLEDPTLVAELRDRQIPLEVCPTSNVCLGVVPSFGEHPLPRLLAEGLYVTLNSDDPPMFNTTLTDEYTRAATTFGFSVAQMQTFVLQAARATLLPATERAALETRLQTAFQ